MDVLELLTDDHSFLSSQVIHVIALHKAFLDGNYQAAPLQVELCRQAQILGQELRHHFQHEEREAFVRLTERFGDAKSRLEEFVTEHDKILTAFEQFSADLSVERSRISRADSLAKAAHFALLFERHATAETRFFEELRRRGFPNADSV